MRILVTGGAGYVGSVTVEALITADHDVVVLDDLSTGHRGAVHPDAHLVVASYADRDAVGTLLVRARIEAILHCGARSIVPESIREPARYYRDNVAGGIALLEAARDADVRRFVFSSSAAVYGSPASTPITEADPLRPINPYGETKRIVEAALADYARAYGVRSVALRYFNVAGASERNGEVHDPETHLIPNLLAAAEGSGPPLTVFGADYPTPDGTAVRDYIDVGDLARAHLLALEATAPGDPRTGADGEPTGTPAGTPTGTPAGTPAGTPTGTLANLLVCNLGSGGGFSVREVLAAAERVLGAPVPHAIGPRRAGDPPVLVASNGRAADLLGWRPSSSSLDSMIAAAAAWRRAHPGGYAG
jgi:UDP-glucose 4-epimerase